MIEVFGKISKVGREKFTVSTTTGLDYTIFQKNAIPLEKNDSFYCPIIDVTSDKTKKDKDYPPVFEMLKHPLVQVSKDKTSCLTIFSRYLKSRALDFYDHLESINPDVFSLMSKLACDSEDNIFQEYFDADTYRDFLHTWYHSKVVRQIRLLGISTEEFEMYKTDGDFYTECINNPYKIYTIPIEKADNISSVLNRKVSIDQKTCGLVVRKIFDFIKKKGWVGIKYEFAKKHFSLDKIEELLKKEYGVIVDGDTLYLKYFHTVEEKLASALVPAKCITSGDSNGPGGPDGPTGAGLSPDQTDAINFALHNKTSIITGSAGTGKTTLIRSFVSIFKKQNIRFLIISFTGKAVARIKEVISLAAVTVGNDPATSDSHTSDASVSAVSTIHRAIAMQKLKFEILIIDEISMVSNDLLYKFFCKYPPVYKIIILGDSNQLRPIDWGDLSTQCQLALPHAVLTTQHRQESKDLSAVFDSILARQMPDESENFSIITTGLTGLFSLIGNLKNDGLQIEQFVVLSPFNKDIGEINKKIQSVYDDGFTSVTHAGVVWKINDKVSAVVNDYKNSIMNGDEGKIINVAASGVKVKFKHTATTFTFNDEIDKINHSFATTVHKSQGSEWPYVLLYISGMSDFITNNIIYTAASRAKKRLWIISKRSVLEKCIQAVMEPRLDNLARKINELYTINGKFD